MDDETGTAKTGDAVPIGEGGKAMQDTTAVMEKMTAATKKGALMSLPSSISKAAFRTSSRSSSAARSDSEAHAKAAQERLHGLEKIVRDVSRLFEGNRAAGQDCDRSHTLQKLKAHDHGSYRYS